MEPSLKIDLLAMGSGRLRACVLALATFFAGWGLPEMGFGDGAVPWLVAFGALGVVVIVVTDAFTRRIASEWKDKFASWAKPILAVLCCVGAFVGCYYWADQRINHQIIISELRDDIDSLSTGIATFEADQATFNPRPTANYWASTDAWFQASSDYKLITNNIFSSRYHKDIVELAYKLRKADVVNDDELKELLWFARPDYPSSDWALEELEKYRSRLE